MPRLLVTLSLLSVLFVQAARPAQAQVGIVDDSNDVIYTFGGQMIFTLVAHSESNIISAFLLVQIGDADHTDVLEVPITPSPRIETKYTWDLQARPIPPFAPVHYSWRLTDADGHTLVTEDAIKIYEDNRFNWQTVGRGAINAHWYNGDLIFGQAIADIGYKALNQVSRFIAAQSPPEINVYVYANIDDLQSGLRLGGREWVAGHADPELGVVLITAAPGPEAVLNLERDLPHELTHVMIYQVVGPGYDNMPRWLDEGLAANNELQPRSDLALALDAAARTDSLITLRVLCAPFAVDQDKALLSYAQSRSMSRYILDRWGPGEMNDLLLAYRDGASCEGGVQRVLNVSLAELQADWQNDVLEASPVTKFLRDTLPALAVFGLPAIAIAALIFAPRRKR
ncbi:MAG: hypothetical protein HYZ49_13535 [Chloroflexi bacterium]|nr:hypothetical protein [Chloroflexota bacterium]